MRPLFTLPISPLLLNNLGKAGYLYVEDVINDRNDSLETILNNHNYTFNEFQALWSPGAGKTASDLVLSSVSEDKSLLTIPTFSQSLDDIMGGGVPIGVVTQICGSPSSGKTQLALQLSVNVQIPVPLGGLSGGAVFIDTESTFTFGRIKEIACHTWKQCGHVAAMHDLPHALKDLSIESFLRNVHFLPALDHFQLFLAIQSLPRFLSSNSRVKIIILDGIALPFLAIDDYSERTRLLLKFVKELSALSKRYRVAVVFTNHLTTRVQNSNKFLSPALGAMLTHVIPLTLLLSKRGEVYSGVVENSAERSRKTAFFTIIQEGIRDVEPR